MGVSCHLLLRSMIWCLRQRCCQVRPCCVPLRDAEVVHAHGRHREALGAALDEIWHVVFRGLTLGRGRADLSSRVQLVGLHIPSPGISRMIDPCLPSDGRSPPNRVGQFTPCTQASCDTLFGSLEVAKLLKRSKGTIYKFMVASGMKRPPSSKKAGYVGK